MENPIQEDIDIDRDDAEIIERLVQQTSPIMRDGGATAENEWNNNFRTNLDDLAKIC
jgi:hypothetical protein